MLPGETAWTRCEQGGWNWEGASGVEGPLSWGEPMAFIDELRKYLQDVVDQPSRARGSASSLVDPATVRSQFVRCLERLEKQERSAGEAASPSRYQGLLHRWQRGDAVVRFAQRLGALLLKGMSRDASPQELMSQIETAMARRLGLPEMLSSTVRTLELDRLSEIAYTEAFVLASDPEPSRVDEYAAAIRATRRNGASTVLTPLGRVFLEFTGRDAIRWLLQVEVAQSTGPGDDWRVSRETARALVQKTNWTIHWTEPDHGFHHSWRTIRRLDALALVRVSEHPEDAMAWIEVLPLGQELLGELVREGESPMSVLAKTLLADLASSAAEVVSKPHLDDSAGRVSAAEATARQARLVAHEIRNALVPVKTSLGALYREALMNPSADMLARRRDGIDKGIDAVFRFVEQLVRLSSLAAKPPEPFDLLSVIRDAVSLVESETAKSIQQVLPAGLPPISGHRERVVMALTNVLRNAAQAVPEADPVIRIGAEFRDDGRAVLLNIEDNGPGVPENMRQAIFEEGISLRQGGSGMGLALVREVFEKEMRGLVDCTASQLGGARFAIRMPAAGAE
jgi:signal transduction histidine kinase